MTREEIIINAGINLGFSISESATPSAVEEYKKRMTPVNLFLSLQSSYQWVSILYRERSEEKRVVSMPTTLGSHEIICMHAGSLV